MTPDTADVPPEGYRLRAGTLEDAPAIADLMDEVNLAEVGTPFGSVAAFDLWLHEEVEGEGSGFDPGLWFLATDGDEVAGVLIGREATPEAADTGEVSELGVRRGWRGRGVGLALLLTVFHELRGRGVRAAQLRVDAESLTGATRLYERAGTRLVQRSEHWEKELGPPR